MPFTLENQIVLITGGSQGLGTQFARKYFKETKNTKIIIVSRSESKLQTAIRSITSSSLEENIENYNLSNYSSGKKVNANKRLLYSPCDLSDYNSVSALLDILLAQDLSPTQIYLCAGGSIPKLFKDLTSKELEMGVQMNYLTSLYLSHKIAQLQLQSHLIFFSSVTAFFPFIGYSQYAPLKVSMKSLVSILRQELLGTNRISCVYPGNFQSEGFELEELTKPEITREIEGPSSPIPVDRCCDIIVKQLQYGYDDITTDLIGWLLMSLDMGLNKHNNNSIAWMVQLIVGALVNLIVVPFYMAFCKFQIKNWFKKEQAKKDLDNKKKEQ
ncbi:3-dehydrosphinganine reductase NDAI_0B04790 [Naumovozyma dairenensis CBS 421]|uniref:3-ketodihydrosphingosine reductase TSC10 n=1 Tax=Naumovozyma dairenensis (strain ATCC 10597 / BCRC 20456 / CBS 421 / NBRC 0211 / NRRL Y-12639) TaxID=1071378 RepID=G0W6V2_NAUDC|nr:hypothetical protein NDAI_0B04790 [Naumovozyma dairenensis CBS 421]CCD23513.1 hypothetical protein NDAI_0B04790 [Naumovozyma dairenensis CBS 421]